MLSMEIGDLKKQDIEFIKEYYLYKIEEVTKELDEIVKIKEMMYPFTDERTVTVKYVPTPDTDKTIEFVIKRLSLEIKKQFTLSNKENKNER